MAYNKASDYRYLMKQRAFEQVRKRFEDICSIDAQFDEAYSKVNWERRNEAETDIVKWINAYAIGLLLDEPPPPHGEEILREVWTAIQDTKRPYMIMQARGSGKTSYVECVVLCALSTGKTKFPVFISHNASSSVEMVKDIFKCITETSTFSEDYPEVCFPYVILNGAFKRRQTYHKHSTELQYRDGFLKLPRLIKEDGTEYATSGSCVACRGITSGLRGLKHGTLRPTCVILDDIQDDESAGSQSAVEKLYAIINKSVLNLGGKGKLSVLQTATPIQSDDLTDRIRKDKAWKTTVFPAIIKWPTDILKNPNDGLWKKYFDLFDEENSMDLKHVKSLKFYKRHQKKMDKGAEVLNPRRYKESDGHISALQALLEKQHEIGLDAFFCEYQMAPKRVDVLLDITPKKVMSKIDPNVKYKQVPDGYIHTFASLDLNTSFAITSTVCCFKSDGSCAMIRARTYKCNIDQKLPDAQYNQELYLKLTDVGKSLKNCGIDIQGIVIDGGGRNFDCVCEWCKNAVSLCGIPACCMLGKASHTFNPLLRSRLKNAVGRTVLCGDDREQVKRGSGSKWINFDSDYFREAVQRSLIMPLGSPGGTVLYNDLPLNHLDFATQVCNEQLKWKKSKPDGRTEYHWSSKDPHDYLDGMAMCFAIACSEGVSTTASIKRHEMESLNGERQRNIRRLQMLRRKRVSVK